MYKRGSFFQSEYFNFLSLIYTCIYILFFKMNSAITSSSNTTSTTTSHIDATSSTSSNVNSRRNSFSSFVKNLLLLVSSTPSSSNANEQDNNEQEAACSEYSEFQNLYFSFPAFIEEPTDESASSCGQSHHQSFITESSRIMC